MDEQEDLYHNSGNSIFIRYAGRYYERVVGKGWRTLSEAPTVPKWDKLHDLQRVPFVKGLQDQGLIDQST